MIYKRREIPRCLVSFFLASCGPKTELIQRRTDFDGFSAFPSESSADAERIKEEDTQFLKKINFPAVVQCHDSGMLFDRRAGQCSSEYKLASFPCDRKGILEKFSDTGMQIVSVLDRALGNAKIPSDRGEGFLIDQCGVNSSDRYLIVLVKAADEGKLTVREIQ